MTYQQDRMPERIQLKVGGASSQQSAVYEEFARNVPGFKPLTERELLSILPKSAPQFLDNNSVGNTSAPIMSTSANSASSVANLISRHGSNLPLSCQRNTYLSTLFIPQNRRVVMIRLQNKFQIYHLITITISH